VRLADDIKKEIEIEVHGGHEAGRIRERMGRHKHEDMEQHKKHMHELHERLKGMKKEHFFDGAEFDFDVELDGVPNAEEIEAIIEKAMKGASVKLPRGKPQVLRFNNDDFDFEFEGVPNADELKKIIEQATEGRAQWRDQRKESQNKWEGKWEQLAPGVFRFDGDDFEVDFEFDHEGMHEHLKEMKGRPHEPAGHVRGEIEAPVALGWAPAEVRFQPEVIKLEEVDEGATYNVVIQKQDGDDSIAVEIKNGKATAKVNGKKVPQDRVKMHGGKVTILGEDGEEMAVFPVIVSPNFAGAWTTQSPRGLSFSGGNLRFGGDDVAFSTQDPPPVMLGITMASPGESVAQHFDLGEGQGIEIQTVIEGLPASEAGLKAKDIIVRIEGADETTPDALRAVLRKKQPGDEIKVKVLRQGDVNERVIKLRKYDPEKLNVRVQVEPQFDLWRDDEGEHWMGHELPKQFWGDFEKSMKEHLGEQLHGHLDEHAIGEAHKAFEEAMKHLKSAPGATGRFRIAPGDGGQWLYLQGEQDGDREFFAVPRQGGAVVSGDLDKQIKSLKDELAEVRRQRDEMAQELKEIKALLKKLAGDRD
jgi:prefoldin subunit 5